MKSSLNPKDISELKIFKQDQLCGVLRRTPKGGSSFKFTEEYLQNAETKDLSLHFKKRTEEYIQEGINLHPFFAGLLPEGLRLKYLQQKVKTSPDDLFSLFAAIGGDSIGDVHTEENQTTLPENLKPNWNSIRFYDYFLKLLELEGEKDIDSIPGVQEKISGSLLSLPIKFKNDHASYILKLSPKDKPNLVYNEWVCLNLAKFCNIEVNDFHLIEDKDNQLGLLVKRFDRYFDINANQIKKIHQEDMCQISNLFPAEKYRISLRDIFEKLEQYSTSPLVDKLKLLKLVVFSYLIGNGDLHAKNISLFENPFDGRLGLTPAYDIICTLLYGDQKMALKMNGKDSNLRRSDFIDFGIRFGLNKVSVENMIDDLLKLFYLNHHILFSINMPDSKMTFLESELSKRMSQLSSL